MSTRKRKASDSLDDTDHDNSPFAPRNFPHHKKRRFDLSRNLSRLSLLEQAQAQAQAPIVQEQPVIQGSPLPSTAPDQDIKISQWLPADQPGLPEDTAMDTGGSMTVPVISQSIIEEPAEQATLIPEVRMRHTSSYEPEKDRIVITDLDSSEDEAETPPQTPAGGDSTYSVSHAFLSRINASKVPTPLLKTPPPIPESDSSQALVLFRRSPWSAKDSRELERIYRDRDEEKPNIDQEVPQIEEPDVDAMDMD